MKKILFISYFLLKLHFVFGQNDACNSGYFPNKAGTKFETTFYDKKDKITTVAKYEVLKIQNSGQGLEVFIKNETYDKKEKLLVKAEYDLKCKNGMFYADARNWAVPFISQQNSSGVEINIIGEGVPYPSTMTAGQKLPDAEMEIKSTMQGGISIMNMKIKITERVVEAIEPVTTPAGTFECVKISYLIDIKFGFVKQKSRNKEYLSKGVGIVKMESFDEKGKKISSQVLTKFQR
ncbi:MAG: hypothetical protein ACK40K_04435 [Raineya sp.]